MKYFFLYILFFYPLSLRAELATVERVAPNVDVKVVVQEAGEAPTVESISNRLGGHPKTPVLFEIQEDQPLRELPLEVVLAKIEKEGRQKIRTYALVRGLAASASTLAVLVSRQGPDAIYAASIAAVYAATITGGQAYLDRVTGPYFDNSIASGHRAPGTVVERNIKQLTWAVAITYLTQNVLVQLGFNHPDISFFNQILLPNVLGLFLGQGWVSYAAQSRARGIPEEKRQQSEKVRFVAGLLATLSSTLIGLQKDSMDLGAGWIMRMGTAAWGASLAAKIDPARILSVFQVYSCLPAMRSF